MARYEPSRKHKWEFSVAGPPLHVPAGSKCPRDLLPGAASEMLDEALELGFTSGEARNGIPRRVYNFRDGVFYEGKITNPVEQTYHGFPVNPIEVPTSVKRKMLEQGKLTERDYRRFRASRYS